ncbi:hypothetical protein TrCOL_g10948 [Triparma columacea]|nr:hypothetical protein TrCOL_g10948 [Triparma columacea]
MPTYAALQVSLASLLTLHPTLPKLQFSVDDVAARSVRSAVQAGLCRFITTHAYDGLAKGASVGMNQIVSNLLNLVVTYKEWPLTRSQDEYDKRCEVEMELDMNGVYHDEREVERKVKELLSKRGDCADDLLKAEVKRLEEGGAAGKVVEDVDNWRLDEPGNMVVKDMWYGICRNLARNEEVGKIEGVLMGEWKDILNIISRVIEGIKGGKDVDSTPANGNQTGGAQGIFSMFAKNPAANTQSSASSLPGTSGAGSMYSSMNGYGSPQPLPAPPTSRSASDTLTSSSLSSPHHPPPPPPSSTSTTTTLKSLLDLIHSLCTHSPKTHRHLLDITLHDNTNLTTALFNLLSSPLNATLKGRVLRTLSSLCMGDDKTSREVWEMLEGSQILPTLLSRNLPTSYNTNNKGGNVEDGDGGRRSREGGGKRKGREDGGGDKGILHEMANVERFSGSYPLTESFLTLLSSLISTVGCPTSLGSTFRRPGASPYVDFAVNTVLNNACNPETRVAMNFESAAARWRLTARALEVVDEVIKRYAVPKMALEGQGGGGGDSGKEGKKDVVNYSQHQNSHAQTLRQASSLGLSPHDIFEPVNGLLASLEEFDGWVKDFKEEWIQVPLANPTSTSLSVTGGSGGMLNLTKSPMKERKGGSSNSTFAALRPKTPAFVVMESVLGGRELLESLLIILTEGGGVQGLEKEKDDATRFARETAMHKVEVEEVDCDDTKDTVRTSVHYGESKGTRGKVEVPRGDSSFWRERSVVLALRVLSAVSAREKAFIESVSAAPGALNVMPVMTDSLTFTLKQPEGTNRPMHGFADPQQQMAYIQYQLQQQMQQMQAQGYLNNLSQQQVESVRAAQMRQLQMQFPKAREEALTVQERMKTQEILVAGGMEVRSVAVTPLASLLVASSGHKLFNKNEFDPISSIGHYVRYTNEKHGELANRACGLFKYFVSQFPPSELPSVIFSRSVDSDKALAAAFASRLLAEGGDKYDEDQQIFGQVSDYNDVRMIILDLLVENLSGPPPTLSHYLLGIVDGTDSWGKRQSGASGGLDCFSAVLSLLNDPGFLTGNKTAPLASRCYELLYRLCGSEAAGEIARGRLRESNFWVEHVNNCLADERGGAGNLFQQVVDMERGGEGEVNITCSAIIHSISWLLKGVSLELFYTLKQNRVRACTDLLTLLFAHKEVKGTTSSTVLSLLGALTLRNPGGGKPSAPPPSAAAKAVAASVVKLQGAADVFGSYCVVDGSKVVKELGEVGVKEPQRDVPGGGEGGPEDGALVVVAGDEGPDQGGTMEERFPLTTQALEWAKEWNSYVLAACSAAHACKGWSTLVATAVVTCTTLLVKESGDGTFGGVIDLNDVNNLLKTALEHLVGESGEGSLESGSALPLCDAILRIVGVMKGCGAELDEALLNLLGRSVSLVGKGEGGEELAGLLSCALALAVNMVAGDGIRQDVSMNLVQAADFLSDVGGGMGANGKLARSGFCSVLGLTGEDKFAVDVLNRDMSRQKLKNLVSVCVGDSEGIWTLVKIACSQIGAKNLLDCGVGSELIQSCGVGEEIGEESSFVGAAWESRGRGGADGGKVAGGALFFGQLKLFGTLLCNLPKSAIVGSEASKFLRMRCVSGVEMLKNFPVDIELVGAYVEVLEALAGGGGWNVNTMGKVGGKIEQGVLSLGLHLSNFPIRKGLEEGRGGAGGGSWWDAINFEAMSSEERGMVGLGGLFNLGGWCERDYEYIEAGLKIAGSCLGFVRGIMERSPELMVVEGTSLSRGLGVCVRLSRVLDTKLKNLIRANNLDESKLGDLENVQVQGDDGDDVLIETKWALLCGRRVRVVCENLLTIAALHLQKLRGKAEELGGGEGVRRGMEGFAKVVIGGLSSSKVETLGLGGDGAEGVVDGGFSKKIARMLREQCEGIVGGEGGKRKGGEWGGDEGGAGRVGGAGGGGLKVWGRRGGRQ